MPDKIADILGKRSFDEPAEIRQIKDFVRQNLASDSSVVVNNDRISISVPNAALAGQLRLELPKLQRILETKKRLIIRIGI